MRAANQRAQAPPSTPWSLSSNAPQEKHYTWHPSEDQIHVRASNTHTYPSMGTGQTFQVVLLRYLPISPRRRRRHGLPQWLLGKGSTCNAGDAGDASSILGWGIFLGRGHGDTGQYSCMENPTDGGAWRATAHGFTKNRND